MFWTGEARVNYTFVKIIDSKLKDWSYMKPTFLAYKRQRPREHVHEIGQPVGMGWTVELTDIHHIVLVF